MQVMETTVDTAQVVDQETLDRVRANFVRKKETILGYSKPWTPWALTYLLEIDDSNTLLPAELILYKALKASSPNRIAIQDADVQVYWIDYNLNFSQYPLLVLLQEEFVTQAKAGQVFFKDGREYTGTHRRFVMVHAGSRKGNVTAGQMWDFVSAISNNDLGIINHFKKTRKISRRMRALTRVMHQQFQHMLHDIPGKLFRDAIFPNTKP